MKFKIPSFWREKMKCERQVKFDGLKIGIPELKIPSIDFSLGGGGIEHKVLQTAGQALMLLDFAAWDYCVKVRDAPDMESQKKYYELMMKESGRYGKRILLV
jgi:hypothetical protein